MNITAATRSDGMYRRTLFCGLQGKPYPASSAFSAS
jgi:hypothetical protein